LADYRFADNSKDYILKDWRYVDFNNNVSSDIEIDSISFRYEGSDTGAFGLNTPKYFCMDDFNGYGKLLSYYSPFLSMPNDTFYNGSDLAGGIQSGPYHFANRFNSNWNSWSGWSYSTMQDDSTGGFQNQFSCIDGASNFDVAGGQQTEIRSVYMGKDSNAFSTYNKNLVISVNNSTYAYLDMLNGSSFSKKFGGVDGTDPDYFRILINLVDSKNEILKSDTVYLADYRFENSADDYILKDYITLVDTEESSLEFHKIVFNLESSDNGTFGMNTPAYFCLHVGIKLIGSVATAISENTLNIYPNPVQNELNLETETTINSAAVFSIDGNQIFETRNEVQSNKIVVSTLDLTPGIYFAIVYTEKGIATKKFIKQ
jgi:hypothetical protein